MPGICRRVGADSRIALWLGVLGFLLVAPFHHGHFQSSDEVAVYEVTRSLWHGSIATPAITYSYPGRDGAYYSQYQPGQSILALPFYGLGVLAGKVLPAAWQASLSGSPAVLGQMVYGGSLEIFFVGLYSCFMTGVLLSVFFLFERELGVSRRNAVTLTLLLGTTTYVATMSGYFLRHTTEAVSILSAFLFFLRFRVGGRMRDLAAASACASLTPLIRIPAAAAGLGLATHALWALWEQSRRGRDAQRLMRLLPLLIVPFVVAVALHALGDWIKWETPFRVVMNDVVGFGHPLDVGLLAYLLSPGMSIFIFSPLLVLVPLAYPVFLERFRPEAIAILVTVTTFLVVFSKFDGWWSGFPTVGPRYLFVATPLLLLALGPWLDRVESTSAWIAVGAFGAIGLAVQLLLLTVDFEQVSAAARYVEVMPQGHFVFLIDGRAPLLAMRTALLEGWFIDPWLWNAYHGREGVPAAPDLVVAVLGAWAVAVSLALVALGRALRADAWRPRQDSNLRRTL